MDSTALRAMQAPLNSSYGSINYTRRMPTSIGGPLLSVW